MANPFLRWAGGKRWLVPFIKQSIEGFDYKTYFEPFVGGGALLFALEPKHSEIGDLNAELIETYAAVRKSPLEIKRRLAKLSVNRTNYNRVRASLPQDTLDRAVRFIFLNRTCFCGLYRVNRKGGFNVPYGGGSRTPAVLTDSAILENAARVLRQTSIKCSDFELTLSRAGRGDLVFCDPTYARKIRTEMFDRYNDKVFSWNDQKRLATACRRATQRGASVIVTNIHCREIRDLYSFGINFRSSRRSAMCSAHPNSGLLEESVIFAGSKLIAHLSNRQEFRISKVA